MNTTAEFTTERQDVWYWMSELFLDTEMLERDKTLLAENLASTSFSLEELDQIMRTEVAPILHPNLIVVAGQWGCWNREDDVIKPIKAHVTVLRNARHKGWSWIQKLFRSFYMMEVQSEWTEVLARVSTIRKQADHPTPP